MDDWEGIYIISLREFQMGPFLESQMFLCCKAVPASRTRVVITRLFKARGSPPVRGANGPFPRSPGQT